MTNGKFIPGDLIFFPSNGNPWDILISIVSPEFTHVGMFLTHDTIIEAALFGNIKVTKFNPAWNYSVYRIGQDLPSDFYHKLYAASWVHRKDRYDVFGAIIFGALRKFGLREIVDKIDNNWWCSEFVAYLVYICTGIRLCPDLSFSAIMPHDIKKDSRIYFIGGGFDE